ncbi:hypothetical protein BC833DRAFT_263630 [Globomyces pollinis-pini]|nr:hypothetical protein BC833DRAFT_263630 [Globomyces pollinis-pini]
MPKPTIPNSIYDPFKGKLKKDLLKSMKSLKSPMVEFDVPFTSNVKLYLLDAQAFLLDLIAQELDPIIESGLLQLQIQPYDFTYFKAVFSDKVYSLSDLLAVLQACRLIGQVSPYLAQLESYFTLIEGLVTMYIYIRFRNNSYLY